MNRINPFYNQTSVLFVMRLTMKWKKWIRPALFTLGGALAGLAYYQWIGCASGSCVITSSPVGSMLYMGLIGWLLSGLFRKERDKCNM